MDTTPATLPVQPASNAISVPSSPNELCCYYKTRAASRRHAAGSIGQLAEVPWGVARLTTLVGFVRSMDIIVEDDQIVTRRVRAEVTPEFVYM